MFTQRRCIAFLFFALVPFANQSWAGISLGVTPAASSIELPTAGNIKQLTMTVTIAAFDPADPNSTTATQDIIGYEVPLDLAPPAGLGLPTGWSIPASSVNVLLTFQSGSVDTTQRTGAVDVFAGAFASVTGTPVPVTLTTTPVPLYEFVVEFSDQAIAANNYTASVTQTAADFSIVDGSFGAITGNNLQFNAATIELTTAVPEPSSVAFCCMALLGSCLRRRRVH